MANIREIKNKKGTSYQVTIRKKGFKPLYKTFDKISEAKKWAKEIEVEIDKGSYKQHKDVIVKPIISLKDLIIDFKEKVASIKYSKPEQYNHMYDWWINKIGDVKVSDINSFILVQCRNILLSESPDKPYKKHKTKSNSTVRKYMFCLSAVLKYAKKELQIIEQNPMSDVDKPKKTKGTPRFLSEVEKELLLNACYKHSTEIALFVLLALSSGGRYNEIRHLKIDNLDFENSMIHFLNTKNGTDRGVPVYIKVMDIVHKYISQKKIESGYLFINEKNKLPYFKGIFEKIVKDTNIENFRFHDCRHTYASWLAQNGASLLEIAELLGHKNLQQVQIYAHLTRKTTSKLVRKMTANMLGDNLSLLFE